MLKDIVVAVAKDIRITVVVLCFILSTACVVLAYPYVGPLENDVVVGLVGIGSVVLLALWKAIVSTPIVKRRRNAKSRR